MTNNLKNRDRRYWKLNDGRAHYGHRRPEQTRRGSSKAETVALRLIGKDDAFRKHMEESAQRPLPSTTDGETKIHMGWFILDK